MKIKTWYYIDSFRVEQGYRVLDYLYLDDEVVYHYKGKQKKEFNILAPKIWGQKLRKYNIKPLREMQNG